MITIQFILAGFLLVIFLVSLTWFVGKKIKNYSIIDAIWALSFFLQALLFYFLSNGNGARRLIALIMLGGWGLRLGYYLALRTYSHHPKVDSRYVQLQLEYGEKFHSRFYFFFLFQALSVSLLTIPFVFVFVNSSSITLFEWSGFALWALALLGETLADEQMKRFKARTENRGKTCNVGLWKYSRHPNYFFESLIWWGFFLVFLGSGIWWGIYAPLLILHILLNVTGVPPSEAQALKNRGEEYRRYQQQTSKFVPWLPKK